VPHSTSLSLPDGYRVRPAHAGDADAVNEVIVASDVAVQGWSESTVEELVRWWRTLEDLERNTWLVERDATVVAYGEVLKHGDVMESDGFVHPDHLARGLGRWLRERMEARAREVGLRRIHTGCLAPDRRAQELFAAAGLSEVRRYYRMVIDLDEPPPPAVVPDGIRLATFRAEDAPAFHSALNESFADEWNFFPKPYEEWVERRLKDPDTDTGVWFIAWDGSEIAGVNRCDPSRLGMGWIGALGVRERWRKRGVGLALLQHSFGEFFRRGTRRVGLGVDATNPTGATRLYERAGMRVAYEAVAFAKELE
jgi:mycothiol synthase